MEYRIVLSRMEFRALHGCYELERKVGNRFTVDLELTAELGDAAVQDDVRKTVNYLTVYEVVRMQMRITHRTGGDEHHRSDLRRLRAGTACKMHRIETGAAAGRKA